MEAARDVTHDRQRNFERHVADARRIVGLHHRAQRAAVHVLEDDEVVVVVHARVEDRHEIRVAQLPAESSLTPQ